MQDNANSEDDFDDLELPDAPDIDESLALPPAEQDADVQKDVS
jgi:hypothetical protein